MAGERRTVRTTTSGWCFPSLISGPFAAGLHTAFDFAIAACLAAAGMSWLGGGKYHYHEEAEPEVQASDARAA